MQREPESEPEQPKPEPAPEPELETPVRNKMERSVSHMFGYLPEEQRWQIDCSRVQFKDCKDRVVLANHEHSSSIEEARQAKFMRISGSKTLSVGFSQLKTPEERVARVKLLRSIVQQMEYEWELETPPMIINVTGNATDTRMRPKFKVCF